jgi:hypothetical protein
MRARDVAWAFRRTIPMHEERARTDPPGPGIEDIEFAPSDGLALGEILASVAGCLAWKASF